MNGGILGWLLGLVAGLVCALAAAIWLDPWGGAGDRAMAEALKVELAGALDGARDGIAFDSVTVTVNGKPAKLAADGSFSALVPLAPYYRVDIGGNGVFPMVQTFGKAELRDPACDCLRIPAIELVAKKPGRIELFFGGDSMAARRYFHMGLRDEPVLDHDTLDADLDRLFDHMEPYFGPSDFASVNLESVVAAVTPGEPAPKRYKFFSPPELPKAMMRAGIDHVSLGNNHTADYRDIGLEMTLDAIARAGLLTSGAGMNVTEAEKATRVTVGSTKLALFGLVGWRGDWTPNQTATATKAGAAWGTREVIDRVTLRELAAGYVPIMEYHGNMEYMDRPSPMSLPRFRRAIDLGSPLVIGHHPHVTQGLEIYKGSLIAHSLGNFLFDQDHPHTHSTFAIKVWLENGRFLRAEVLPINMLDYRPVPAVGGMRESVLRRVFWLSAEMGTNLALTGGHAAVWRENRPQGNGRCRQPEGFTLANFGPSCGDGASEYGRNLIPRGDFSNAQTGPAQDRFWKALNGKLALKRTPMAEGYLELSPRAAHKSFYLHSASYIRDVYATRFTLKSRIRLPHDAEIELIIRDKPPEGAKPTPSVLGESMQTRRLRGSGEWQDIAFDFWLPPGPVPRLPPGPDGAAHPFRPILRIKYLGEREGDDDRVLLDDIRLIEWPPEYAQRDAPRAWWFTDRRPKPKGTMAAR
ncbi:CapA family protein [Erythrobacter sp. SDW2]|uniref:CapA family protein n=1 Tax=Erythrobacter sp. SDW2 TaxID=2907154 RepID=UPI001F19FE61|nr:CapA family protein [Erythrobacter sp. SDW2]UIP05582.1 CapA family protein [Erythrobacter sp. SDW2]